MSTTIIDCNGYRLNVGIVLINHENKLLWAKRLGKKNAWQFPQGGIRKGEANEQAMYRELKEELGLGAHYVQILAESDNWKYYKIPELFRRITEKPLCIGQKQRWYLLRLKVSDDHINLNHSNNPEFDQWCWVDIDHPLTQVIAFKREVYCQVLAEFADLIEA